MPLADGIVKGKKVLYKPSLAAYIFSGGVALWKT
jgi:hypothetical protein